MELEMPPPPPPMATCSAQKCPRSTAAASAFTYAGGLHQGDPLH